MIPETVPYCGPPATPDSWTWNLDPVLLAAWLCAAVLYEGRARRAGAVVRERAGYHAGASIALAAWVSPLCALGVALFSARVAQHMLLALLAAPLLARALRFRTRRAARRRTSGGSFALAASLVFAATSWLWHVPPFYDATLESHTAYWSMQLSLLASAVALWYALLANAPPGERLAPVAWAAFTSLQMGLLGALLTFAPTSLYEAHLETTRAFGLSPLEDQQLGGLILWIPGCAVFAAVALAALAAWLAREERRMPGPGVATL